MYLIWHIQESFARMGGQLDGTGRELVYSYC